MGDQRKTGQIRGLIIDTEANEEVNLLVTKLLVILELKDIKQPYVFDLTEDSYVRNIILSRITDEEVKTS